MKRACIVGYGAVGTVHAVALQQCDAAIFYAVCDNDDSKIKKCQEKYNVCGYLDFDEMLKDKEIQVVHICTPHYLHKEMAKKVILAGKELILEKPVTMRKEELQELYELKTHQKIGVMLQNRTNNCLEKLHEIILQDDTLGDMKGISAFLTWERNEAYYHSASWRGKWETEGGGLLINQAIHTIDIMNWLGGGIKSVKASISTKSLNNCIEVEDTADARFEMNNGCKGIFFGTNGYSLNTPMRIEVSFKEVTFRYADNKLYRIDKQGVEILAEDKKVEIGKQYWGSGHFNVINAFYQDREGKYPTLEDAKQTMQVLFAMYESAKHQSRAVEIDADIKIIK